jgi:hypothetical protein
VTNYDTTVSRRKLFLKFHIIAQKGRYESQSFQQQTQNYPNHCRTSRNLYIFLINFTIRNIFFQGKESLLNTYCDNRVYRCMELLGWNTDIFLQRGNHFLHRPTRRFRHSGCGT